MSAEYEAALEIRAVLDPIRDAVERIADATEAMLEPAASSVRLERLERILWELYPDSCRRAGLVPAEAPKGGA